MKTYLCFQLFQVRKSGSTVWVKHQKKLSSRTQHPLHYYNFQHKCVHRFLCILRHPVFIKVTLTCSMWIYHSKANYIPPCATLHIIVTHYSIDNPVFQNKKRSKLELMNTFLVAAPFPWFTPCFRTRIKSKLVLLAYSSAISTVLSILPSSTTIIYSHPQ